MTMPEFQMESVVLIISEPRTACPIQGNEKWRIGVVSSRFVSDLLLQQYRMNCKSIVKLFLGGKCRLQPKTNTFDVDLRSWQFPFHESAPLLLNKGSLKSSLATLKSIGLRLETGLKKSRLFPCRTGGQREISSGSC